MNKREKRPSRTSKRPWTDQDDALLRRLYPDTTTADCADRLGRSLAATYNRAAKLELLKSATYLASPQACRLLRGDNVGARTRFQKGHVPANKGLRRPGFGPGRMRATQFKRGAALNGTAKARFRPVGSTRLIDGYIYRKISAIGGVSWTRNWKPEHVLVWTRAHGPLPRSHVVVFIDGDPKNTALENLECISRRSLMQRNTVHNLPKPLAETVQLLGALNRKIRWRHREKQDHRSSKSPL